MTEIKLIEKKTKVGSRWLWKIIRFLTQSSLNLITSRIFLRLNFTYSTNKIPTYSNAQWQIFSPPITHQNDRSERVKIFLFYKIAKKSLHNAISWKKWTRHNRVLINQFTTKLSKHFKKTLYIFFTFFRILLRTELVKYSFFIEKMFS